MSFFIPEQINPRPSTSNLLDDQWLATSALQKTIRRGDLENALVATSFLLDRNPRRFWQRLNVIAMEDIGIGDLETVADVLLVSGRQRHRDLYGGEWHFASNLVARLCAAPKCRDACDALVIADLHPRLERARSSYIDYPSKRLAKIVMDDSEHVGRRTLAAWLLAGTHRFPAANLPERTGEFSDLLAVYEAMGVQPFALEVARHGSTRTQEGHPLSLPLIALLGSGGVEVDAAAEQETNELIGGWPAYAYDMHTRTGRIALARFGQRCTEIKEFRGSDWTLENWNAFLGTLVFRGEGERVDRRVRYEGSNELHSDAEVAHLTHHGLTAKRATEALAVLQAHSGLLHQCRLEVSAGAAR